MAEESKEKQKPSVRMKIFDVIGVIAFLLLLPPILSMFGINEPLNFLEANLKGWGSTIALLLYFYGLHFLRIFFGSDVRLTPVFMSYVVSFLFFSISFNTISFMSWFYNLSHQASFFAYDPSNCVAAMLIVLIGNGLSSIKNGKVILDILLIIVLPVALVVLAGIFLMRYLVASPNVTPIP